MTIYFKWYYLNYYTLVFLTTTAWSIFAYVRLFLILVVISPNEVTLWEAVITFLCFPVLVINSYMAEKNFFLKSKEISDEEEAHTLKTMCNILTKNAFI